MADTNIQIKLAADGKQVRNELKLIDKELRELGGDTKTSGTRTSSTVDRESSGDGVQSKSKRDSKSNSQQESRDKIFQTLSREATLIRKELQSLNQNGGVGGQRSGGSSTPPPNSGGTSPSSPSVPPAGSGSGDGGKSGGKLAGILGKLATAAVALKAVSSVWNYANEGAKSSASGESLAYQTYGSTLVYTDYYDAKKGAKELGAPFGYNYETVMGAGNANMSKAGFTTLENYESDMTSLLGTSKAWGIDASSLANTSGFMTSIGVTESGNQKKFADMLAESIVTAEMTGREDEQLQVLETISENLSRTMVKVDDASLNNVMGLYTSLANNNETLKGSRGASIVESVNDSIVNGSSTLDALLGWGTDYTGVEGRVELEKLKEQGLTNPETLQKIFKNFEGYTGKSIDSSYGQMFLSNQMGLSYSQVEALLASKDEIMAGTYSTDLTGEKGFEATKERLQNYDGSDVRTQEQYDIEKHDTKENVGEGLNNLLNPFRSWYSSLGDGGRTAVDAVMGAGKLAVGIGGAKLGSKALGKAFEGAKSWFKGTGSGTTAGAGVADDVASAAAGSADDVARAAGSSVDDVARAAAGSTDDVLGATGRAVAGSADEVVGGLSKGASILGKAGKALGVAGIVIEGVTTTYDAVKAHERGDDREMSQEIGGGVGSIAGGAGGAWGGAALGAAIGSVVPGLGTAIGGAIGAIVGGIGGALGGNALGEAAGEGIYDLTTGGDVHDWTNEQKAQVSAYYQEVERLYEEDGNNAAQEYTKKYVSPYLNSIGVSTSYTDKYNTDVGRPDFMKDIEDGLYGVSGNEHLSSSGNLHGGGGRSFDELHDNTKATEDLTEQLEKLNGEVSSSGSSIIQENNDELLAKQKDESEFKWYNPATWFSHATGNDYIPYDNYKASLHKGETVLDKFEAEDYRQGKTKQGGSHATGKLDLNINVTGSIPGITSDNQNRIIDAVVSKISKSNLQDMISTGFTRVQNY